MGPHGAHAALTASLTAAACTLAPSRAASTASVEPAAVSSSHSAVNTSPAGSATRPRSTQPRSTPPAHTSAAAPRPTGAPPAVSSPAPVVARGGGPVIVLDPGHAPAISHTDPATGLNDSDYENEPEMRDVFDVALLVKAKLVAAGYRVVMTKNNVDDQVPLGQRAAIANNAHAALALSIHDQAGSSGGIGFRSGNNIVYYQSTGDYRQNPSGTKIYFTDREEAAVSARYGQIFAQQRQAVEGVPIALQGNVGYDLGSRGLAPGNIWIVQLLSHVPWIYNESGGNSAGMSGLNSTDKQTYADGLVAAVEHCVPIH
jgi:N-acetylmuramoyl-L-alanine amidase